MARVAQPLPLQQSGEKSFVETAEGNLRNRHWEIFERVALLSHCWQHRVLGALVVGYQRFCGTSYTSCIRLRGLWLTTADATRSPWVLKGHRRTPLLGNVCRRGCRPRSSPASVSTLTRSQEKAIPFREAGEGEKTQSKIIEVGLTCSMEIDWCTLPVHISSRESAGIRLLRLTKYSRTYFLVQIKALEGFAFFLFYGVMGLLLLSFFKKWIT